MSLHFSYISIQIVSLLYFFFSWAIMIFISSFTTSKINSKIWLKIFNFETIISVIFIKVKIFTYFYVPIILFESIFFIKFIIFYFLGFFFELFNFEIYFIVWNKFFIFTWNFFYIIIFILLIINSFIVMKKQYFIIFIFYFIVVKLMNTFWMHFFKFNIYSIFVFYFFDLFPT